MFVIVNLLCNLYIPVKIVYTLPASCIVPIPLPFPISVTPIGVQDIRSCWLIESDGVLALLSVHHPCDFMETRMPYGLAVCIMELGYCSKEKMWKFQ